MTNLLDLITPTNLDSERDKFLASIKYNPTFQYIWQIKPVDLTFTAEAKNRLWDAIKTQNHEQIVIAASEYFEVEISDDTLQRAYILAKTKGKISSGTAQEYVSLMEKSLSDFGLSDIKVVLTEESGYNSRPNHRDKLLLVSKHIHFEYFSVEGGVNHELVHILRYANGEFNKIDPSGNFLPTEEGLASWCQDNTNDDNGVAQHAMEYIASSIGLKGSLRDIFNTLTDLGMTRELAWKRACRHKFGFIDTSRPGDILKPAMYFANEEKVAKLSRDEKLRLFVGKIPVSELPDHPTYTGLWPEKK